MNYLDIEIYASPWSPVHTNSEMSSYIKNKAFAKEYNNKLQSLKCPLWNGDPCASDEMTVNVSQIKSKKIS